MDWMYNKPGATNPEEYLLGKPIDKGHFKEASPTNFMRSIKDEPVSSHSQVELSKRIKEDPLTIIKEKELEKKRILWKKSQLKNSDPKMIAVQPVVVEQSASESKSIHQLVVENLRQLPLKVDLEKLYNRLKERKKEKKTQKRSKSTSQHSRSPSGDRYCSQNNARPQHTRSSSEDKYRSRNNSRPQRNKSPSEDRHRSRNNSRRKNPNPRRISRSRQRDDRNKSSKHRR